MHGTISPDPLYLFKAATFLPPLPHLLGAETHSLPIDEMTEVRRRNEELPTIPAKKQQRLASNPVHPGF